MKIEKLEAKVKSYTFDYIRLQPQLWLVFLIVFLLRLTLLNINVTEIGDSYNLLSAGESLKHFSYPLTEKRLPFLPILLSLNHWMAPLLWGRLLVLVLSLLTIVMTVRFYQEISHKNQLSTFLVALLATHPLWSYWSFRIMTDVLFGLLLMLSIVFYLRRKHWRVRDGLILGFIVGLSALTRFEGFLLIFAFGLPLLIKNLTRPLVAYASAVVLIILPFLLRNFLIFGNPFHTSYAGEVEQTLLGPRLFLVFLSYLFFLVGPLGLYYLRCGLRGLKNEMFWKLLPLLLFLMIYLPLMVIWTAAIPRLFYPLVPFFLTFVVLGFESIERWEWRDTMKVVAFFLLFLVLVVFLRLDFLAGSFGAMVFLCILSLLGLGLIWLRPASVRKVLMVMILINLIVSTSVIGSARSRFATTKAGVEYAQTLPPGIIGYADETGVSSWYLHSRGLYWNGDTGYTEALNWMRENKIRYLIVTNEHYEEGAQFHVVYDRQDVNKFKLLKRFERRDGVEPFNLLLENLRVKKPKNLPVKYTEVYEIVSYRPAGD